MAPRTGLVVPFFTAVPPTTVYRAGQKISGHSSASRLSRRRPWKASIGFAVPGKAVSEHHDLLQVTVPLARQQGAGPQLGSGSAEVSHQPVDRFRRSGPKPFEHTPTVCI